MILGNAPDGLSDIKVAVEAEDSFRENLEHAQVIEYTCIGPEQLPPKPTILRDQEAEYRCRLAGEYVVEVFGLDKQ